MVRRGDKPPTGTPLDMCLETVADVVARFDNMSKMAKAVQRKPFQDCVTDLMRTFSKLQTEIEKLRQECLVIIKEPQKRTLR